MRKIKYLGTALLSKGCGVAQIGCGVAKVRVRKVAKIESSAVQIGCGVAQTGCGAKLDVAQLGCGVYMVVRRPVWRIRDVYPGSRILIFTHSGSRIQKQ
jgi:hypothetical protein